MLYKFVKIYFFKSHPNGAINGDGHKLNNDWSNLISGQNKPAQKF